MKKLLTLTLTLALLLTGCGMQAAPAETPEATASTVVRTETVYPLPAPAELVGVACVGDTLLLGGESGGAPVLGMAAWSLDGAPALGETRLLDAARTGGGGRGAALGRRRRGGLFLCPDRRGARLAAERLARDRAQ